MQAFLKPLSPEEEEACLRRWEAGSPEARSCLIEHNMRLVAHVIKKYNLPEKEIEDMLSIGTIGLIKAVDTYRPGKSRLATYAIRCVENEVLMHFRTEKKYKRDLSLYDSVGTDKVGNEIRLVDIIEYEDRDVVEDLYRRECLDKVFEHMEECLNGRELEILKMRYGWNGGEELTQREAAEKLGISRSYVSRIEKRALGKLKELLET